MIIVKEIKSKRDLRKFINFPNILFKDEKNYVPAMYSDEMNLFNRNRNSAYEYCETKLFLAYKDNKIAGRICAIINHAYNKKVDKKQLRFSRFDVIDDIEVTKALFTEVFEWGKKRGLNELVGPNGFCDFDKEGMLIEGYDELGSILTYYSFPYYKEHLEKLGFEKEVDWVEYRVFIPKADDPIIAKLDSLSKKVAERYNYHMDFLTDFRHAEDIICEAFDVINDAFKNLYGVVPLNEGQKKFYIKQFVPLAQTDFAFFVRNSKGKMIGMGFLVPSLAKALKKSNGKLFPFGFIRVLKALKVYEVMDMYMVAVLPEYQNQGVNAMIISQALKGCIKHNVQYAETGPELEYNTAVQSQWKFFERKQHKRRRLFKIEIK